MTIDATPAGPTIAAPPAGLTTADSPAARTTTAPASPPPRPRWACGWLM